MQARAVEQHVLLGRLQQRCEEERRRVTEEVWRELLDGTEATQRRLAVSRSAQSVDALLCYRRNVKLVEDVCLILLPQS
jgi:hypothetical protein